MGVSGCWNGLSLSWLLLASFTAASRILTLHNADGTAANATQCALYDTDIKKKHSKRRRRYQAVGRECKQTAWTVIPRQIEKKSISPRPGSNQFKHDFFLQSKTFNAPGSKVWGKTEGDERHGFQSIVKVYTPKLTVAELSERKFRVACLCALKTYKFW